jgi:hypothetical protein
MLLGVRALVAAEAQSFGHVCLVYGGRLRSHSRARSFTRAEGRARRVQSWHVPECRGTFQNLTLNSAEPRCPVLSHHMGSAFETLDSKVQRLVESPERRRKRDKAKSNLALRGKYSSKSVLVHWAVAGHQAG